jgi:hypothetical protein
VYFCLTDKKRGKSRLKPKRESKPSLPKEPELVDFYLAENKKVKAGSNPT